jgi:hypothetical protein
VEDVTKKLTRKDALRGIVVLPALAGLIAGSTAIADAKGTKEQFKYQGSPKDGHSCDGCHFFVVGKSATASGTCQIVSGSISPHGWCTAWAAKS